jgi:subtilisin family serine protease
MDQVASWKQIFGSATDYTVQLKTNIGVETLKYAATMATNSSVSFTEPNAWTSRTPLALPNDPLLPLQWQNQNTGQTGGTAGADVKAVGAWDRNVTGTNVVIAVIDSGVELTHPDLQANIFTNINEIPNDGVDNDNNGYIDDVNGWNFFEGNNNANPDPNSNGYAHGTAVAGLAAAVGNNGIGVAGVAYNSQILPIRIGFGNVSASIFIDCVYYAAGLGANGTRVWRGADVINGSYGGGAPIQAEANAWLAASTSGRGGLGTLCFASSGNDADLPGYVPGTVAYPASYPGVMAVGGSDYNDQWVSYSQYGSRLSIVAPTGIGFENPASSTPNAYDLTTDITGNLGYNPPDSTGFPPQYPVNQVSVDYTSFNGTSAASPMAAGVGALCVAANPNATLAEIQDALFSTADQIGGATYTTTPSGPYGTYNGWNEKFGYGRVDAASAVAKLQQFSVVSTTPANNATVTTALQQLLVTFSAPVDISSVNAADLIFSSLPTGVTVTVGTPTIYNNNPLVVAFPLTFTAAPTTRINGTFGYSIAADSIKSTTGKFVAAYAGNFNYNDLAGPRVTGVSVESRKINVTFSEVMRSNTMNLSSVQLYRANGSLNPRNTLVTNVGDPRVAVSYDTLTGKMTLDLTNLPQNLLPTDTYTLVLKDTIRDMAGNLLDGEYNGTLPSGNGTEGSDFVYGLGLR